MPSSPSHCLEPPQSRYVRYIFVFVSWSLNPNPFFLTHFSNPTKPRSFVFPIYFSNMLNIISGRPHQDLFVLGVIVFFFCSKVFVAWLKTMAGSFFCSRCSSLRVCRAHSKFISKISFLANSHSNSNICYIISSKWCITFFNFLKIIMSDWGSVCLFIKLTFLQILQLRDYGVYFFWRRLNFRVFSVCFLVYFSAHSSCLKEAKSFRLYSSK